MPGPAVISSLFPDPGRFVTPLEANDFGRMPHSDRPYVFTNMIASLDGATAVGGLSGELGGPADLEVFLSLRAAADIIIVGAATAIDESYKPPNPSPTVRAARLSRGQAEVPAIAVITRKLSIDIGHPLFSDPGFRPLILTGPDAPTDRVEALSAVADVKLVGESGVDLVVALKALRSTGHRTALLEGGPSLNGQFIAADLIDEWNITTSPILAGGPSSRPATGQKDSVSLPFELTHLWTGDGLLFSRWLRKR